MDAEANNVPKFLSGQLDSLEFFESFAYIWEQWRSRPYLKVEGIGWIFKFLLWFLSVLDIWTDFSLFFDYTRGTKEYYEDLVEDQYSKIMGNAPTLTCSSNGQAGFVCVRYNYWFAMLTLLFIYLPSVNVIVTLYGPHSAGLVGFF